MLNSHLNLSFIFEDIVKTNEAVIDISNYIIKDEVNLNRKYNLCIALLSKILQPETGILFAISKIGINYC